MTYKEIVARVSDNTGLSKSFVDKVYKAYWRTIKEYVESLPLKGECTEEDFHKMRCNINIPSIGKFYISDGRFRNLKKYKTN